MTEIETWVIAEGRHYIYIYLFVGSVRKKEGNCVDLEEELLEAVIACMKQMYLFCHRCAIIVGNPTFSLSNVILRHLGYIYRYIVVNQWFSVYGPSSTRWSGCRVK